MTIRGIYFCFCSNEMQLRRIWRAKQNEYLLQQLKQLNPTTIPWGTTHPHGKGWFLRQSLLSILEQKLFIVCVLVGG